MSLESCDEMMVHDFRDGRDLEATTCGVAKECEMLYAGLSVFCVTFKRMTCREKRVCYSCSSSYKSSAFCSLFSKIVGCNMFGAYITLEAGLILALILFIVIVSLSFWSLSRFNANIVERPFMQLSKYLTICFGTLCAIFQGHGTSRQPRFHTSLHPSVAVWQSDFTNFTVTMVQS